MSCVSPGVVGIGRKEAGDNQSCLKSEFVNVFEEVCELSS